MKIFYLCDRRACEKCNSHGNGTECKHTSDIRHAVNFEVMPFGDIREREPIEASRSRRLPLRLRECRSTRSGLLR